MTSASQKSSSVRAKLSQAISEAGQSEAGDKRARILSAAQRLFLLYGVKRTSIDDVALEADIAKGTVYLYYKSKNDLFADVSARLCSEILVTARETLSTNRPLTERLVGVLDSYIGRLHRLTAQSPHIAELTESKGVLAASIYADFESQMQALIRTALNDSRIAGKGACEMFFAAAIGALKTGDIAERPYRVRLGALVDTLILGLKTHRKAGDERSA
jgi:AcrR family transcriptional regulator